MNKIKNIRINEKNISFNYLPEAEGEDWGFIEYNIEGQKIINKIEAKKDKDYGEFYFGEHALKFVLSLFYDNDILSNKEYINMWY